MNHTQAYDKVKKEKLVAILRDVPKEKTLRAVEALYLGGVRVMEFTFDHTHPGYLEDTLEKLRLAEDAFGKDMVLGCGTVLTVAEAQAAMDQGAELIVSPHMDPAVIAFAKERGAVSLPGAFTPTEIVAAHAAGADFVKLFPAGDLGLGYIKAIRAPLPHIPLFAVGGVTHENVGEFLSAGICGFGVGTGLTEPAALQADDYGRITKRALDYTRAIAAWEGRA